MSSLDSIMGLAGLAMMYKLFQGMGLIGGKDDTGDGDKSINGAPSTVSYDQDTVYRVDEEGQAFTIKQDDRPTSFLEDLFKGRSWSRYDLDSTTSVKTGTTPGPDEVHGGGTALDSFLEHVGGYDDPAHKYDLSKYSTNQIFQADVAGIGDSGKAEWIESSKYATMDEARAGSYVSDGKYVTSRLDSGYSTPAGKTCKKWGSNMQCREYF